jgi:hypothetical protein
MLADVPQFLHGQLTTPPMPQVDMTGQTVIITGASSGLGASYSGGVIGCCKTTSTEISCKVVTAVEMHHNRTRMSVPDQRGEGKSRDVAIIRTLIRHQSLSHRL